MNIYDKALQTQDLRSTVVDLRIELARAERERVSAIEEANNYRVKNDKAESAFAALKKDALELSCAQLDRCGAIIREQLEYGEELRQCKCDMCKLSCRILEATKEEP